MDSTDPEVKDNVDVDNNSQIRETKTPPSMSNRSQSSSPSCSILLVIDDNSNSEDSTVINTNNIPAKSMPSTIVQTPPILQPTILPPTAHDIVNSTAEQQRRRNSSIAKLLGGHPLNNHQYEEIHQQILVDQSAQNVTNNSDNGIDNGIQRSRSSITRTLLMNPERTNSVTKLSSGAPSTTSSPVLQRDFEYLIRQELDKVDTEHSSSSTSQRNNSTSKIFQNTNSPTNATVTSPTQSKLKRKRPTLKPPLPPIPSNNVPFSLHEPFELGSSATNSAATVNSSHSHDEFLRFDSSKRSRHTSQQLLNIPVNTSTTNHVSYPYSKMNMNSSPYNHLNIHRDPLPPSNYSHYSHTTKLTLPSSSIPHLSSPTTIPHDNNNMTMAAPRKAKSIFASSDVHDPPRQRSYSSTFIQSSSSLAGAASSEPSVPLKKRLLHAYNNEQGPTTPL